MKTQTPTPTNAELQILRVLWKRAPLTVREVHEALETSSGYTTVLKTMQIMAEKGLVVRDESNRSHLYRPAVEAAPTERRLIGELVEKAFDGSAVRLAMRALSTGRASRAELEEVRQLLKRLEREK